MNEVAYRLVRKATARGRPCSVGPEGGIDLRVRASVNSFALAAGALPGYDTRLETSLGLLLG